MYTPCKPYFSYFYSLQDKPSDLYTLQVKLLDAYTMQDNVSYLCNR